MNAGEQVTYSVIHDFMELLGEHGLAPYAMQPAFGMAEACTCMTYVNDFDFNKNIHWILKSSLAGKLIKSDRRDNSTTAFVDLGKPVPGVKIRNYRSKIINWFKKVSLFISNKSRCDYTRLLA